MAVEYYSANEAASILEVSSATVRNWTKAGLLTPIEHDGKNISYSGDDLKSIKAKIESGELKEVRQTRK